MNQRHQYWGKYRGKVIENADPLAMGRILVEVPQVPGTLSNWAMPCVPYAGPEVGFFAMPEVTANVWIEFEGGDPSFPIWTGCFWSEGEAPLPFAEDPLMKVFKTPGNMLLFDDTPVEGGATLLSNPPAVDDLITLKFSSEGVLLTAPPGVFNMSIEEGITMEFPPCVQSMTEAEFTITIPASAIVMTEEGMEITAPDISATAEAAIELEAGADISMLAAGVFDIEVPLIDVTAAMSEWLGNINLTGALEMEGNMNVVGAVEFEGEHNVLGAMQLEGDVNLLGPMQIEGGLVVLGVILQDGLPVMVIPI